MGSDDLPVMYDGYNVIARGNASSIIIAVNYRVATMGFLGGEALRQSSPDHSTGNWGVQDQQQGLKFAVEVLLPALGGNPNQVAIFGESAGGASVSLMLTNPKMWGKFSRAIVESGPIASWIVRDTAKAENNFQRVAHDVGCTSGNATHVIDCMRALPWQNFTALEKGVMDPHYGPVLDGVAVPVDPLVALSEGLLAPGVPVLLGTNEDEGTAFSLQYPATLNHSAYLEILQTQFGADAGSRVYRAIPPDTFGTPWDTLARISGDISMNCPNRNTAEMLSSAKRIGGAQSTYVYKYAHVNSVVRLVNPRLGACHATELISVWNIMPEIMLTGPGEVDLSYAMIRYWMRFAATGDPNGAADPPWAPFTAESDSGQWHHSPDWTLVLNITPHGQLNVTNARGVWEAECATLRSALRWT
jgi:para-nitrobenzyl esterase